MITFNTEYQGSQAPQLPIQPQLIERWVQAVAAAHGRSVADVAYLFVDDERILAVNRQFLGHDYYTDIITFDYSEGPRIGGDLIISLDTVQSNAQLLGQPYERELHRVVVHGILHLCGINDKGPGEREIMEAEENRALQLLDQLAATQPEADTR